MFNYVDLPEGYTKVKVEKGYDSPTISVENVTKELRKFNWRPILRAAAIVVGANLAPTIAGASGFGDLHGSVMTLFDYGVVLIIIFAGAAWSIGHRGKAIEILMGVCCGYLLARHAVEIRDYLRSIGPTSI